MDAKKLEALRQKYAGAKGADIFNPSFAAVAAQIFTNADQRKWPFAGAATFLGLGIRGSRLTRLHAGTGAMTVNSTEA